MKTVLAIVCLAAAINASDNLLQNPGFEAISDGSPDYWHLFVQPMEGALGAVDYATVHSGKASVILYNPQPYAREPANNWSQNIVRDLTGKELVVSGWIKTQDATEAEIWVQCCQKAPLQTLRFQSTGDTTPISGTRDWTSVETRVKVPDGTDFVTVRCVLKGKGRAWFDDISVRDSATLIGTPPSATTPSSPIKNKSTEKKSTKAPTPKTTPPNAQTIEDLLKTNEALRESVRTLRETNESLATQLQTQQKAIQDLRDEVHLLRENAQTMQEQEAQRKATPVPPLVPGARP